MEESKKKAIERLRQKMKQDYEKGYNKAIEMINAGRLDLQEAEGLVDADEPVHEVFVGESEKFVKGFTDSCAEMLRKAKESED